MNSEPYLYSIIIPVYNTPKDKITRCLSSVQKQTCQNFECIIIDDGSCNDTRECIQQLKEKLLTTQYKFIFKNNGGVSSARNAGLLVAKGEWIVFLDSDDALKNNHLEKMAEAISDDVDIVMTGFEDAKIDKANIYCYNKERYLGLTEIKRFFIETSFIEHQIPWDRTYRNKRNIDGSPFTIFDEKLSLSEDRLFCYNYLLHTNGIATIPFVTYWHDATDETSLTYRKYPSYVNRYKYGVFKNATQKLIERYRMSLEESKTLQNYMESVYAQLINSYREEGHFFQYYKARLLFRLGLL